LLLAAITFVYVIGIRDEVDKEDRLDERADRRHRE
jgi:hypothetical protein